MNYSKIKNRPMITLSIGVLLGVSLTNFTVFANDIKTYILSKVNYPIIVNNVEYNDDELPALNYNNSTYVPLRAVGNILDAKVEWNEELRRVEIGDVVNNNEANTINSISIDDYISSIDIYNEWNLEDKYVIFQNVSKNNMSSFDVYIINKDANISTFVYNIPNKYIYYFEGRGYILKDFYNTILKPELSKLDT